MWVNSLTGLSTTYLMVFLHVADSLTYKAVQQQESLIEKGARLNCYQDGAIFRETGKWTVMRRKVILGEAVPGRCEEHKNESRGESPRPEAICERGFSHSKLDQRSFRRITFAVDRDSVNRDRTLRQTF